MHACPTPVVSCSNRFSPLQSRVTFPKWWKKVAARHELNPTRDSTRKEQPKADLRGNEEYIRLETVLAQARAYKLHREVYPHSRLTKAQFFVNAKPAAVLGQPTPCDNSNRKVYSLAGMDMGQPFLIDSGASSRDGLMTAEMKIIRKTSHVVYLQTANGVIEVEEEVSITLQDLGGESIVALILDNTPAVLSLGKLIRENHYTYVWQPGQPPTLREQNGAVIVLHEDSDVPLLGNDPGYESAAPASDAAADVDVEASGRPAPDTAPDAAAPPVYGPVEEPRRIKAKAMKRQRDSGGQEACWRHVPAMRRLAA